MNQAIPFSIRVSARAKWASLRMSVEKGLVVVVPRHYDLGKVPVLVESKRQWIEKHRQRFEQIKSTAAPSPDLLPSEIVFAATGEKWLVHYENYPRHAVRVCEKGGELILRGNVESRISCYRALRRWLLNKGKELLLHWLARVSAETQIPYSTSSVRLQRTRWGSCSRRGRISINAKLLFLAPELVRYLFIHELCHRLQMNHSWKYWKCVEDREPEYKVLDGRMRTAMRSVPRWAM